MPKKIKNKSFLASISKFTGLDASYFIKGGLWLSLNQGIIILSSLIVTIFLARFLTKGVYGQYQFILAILGIVSIFSLPGIFISIRQSVAKGYDSSLIVGTKSMFKWSFLGSFALLLTASYFYFIRHSPMWIYLVLCALFFPALYSFSTYGSYLTGKEKFNKIAKLTLIFYIFFTAIMLFALFVFKNLFWVVVAYCFSMSFVSFCLYKKVAKRVKKTEKIDKGLIPYGKKLTLISIIPVISTYLDRLIIPCFLGLQNLAVYAIALMIPENAGRVITKIISPLTFAKTTRFKTKVLLNKIKKNFLYIAIALLIFIALIWFLMPYLLPLLVGTKYKDAVFYSQILSLGVFFTFFTSFFQTVMQAKKKTKQLFFFNTYSSLLQIVLFLILIPLLGIWGAIFTKIAIKFFQSLISYLLVK